MMDEPPLRLCGLCGVESTVVYGENDREGDENAQEGDFPALTDLIKQFILIDIDRAMGVAICVNCFRLLSKLRSFSRHCQKVHSMLTDSAEVATDLEELRSYYKIDHFSWKTETVDPEVPVREDDHIMPDFIITPRVVFAVQEEGDETVNIDNPLSSLNELPPEIILDPVDIILAEQLIPDDPTMHLECPDQLADSEDDPGGHSPPPSRSPFECEMCGKVLANRNSLHTHKQSHLRLLGYECHICSKSFFRSDVLKNHLLIHSGTRSFHCDQCGKSFVRSADLKSHRKTHETEKPFSCDDCGKSFKRRGDLRSHQTTHSDRKHKFGCDICAREFLSLGGLSYHLKIHSGSKPYECTKCSKAFRQSANLTKHMKVHLLSNVGEGS